MTKRLSRFLTAAAVVSLAACGGSDGGPNWASEVDEATATAAGESAAEFAQGLAYDMLNGDFTSEIPLVKGTTSPTFAEQLLARVRSEAYRRSGNPAMGTTASPFRVSAVCEPTETGIDELGDPIDTDGDGVPDDYKVSFGSGCTETEGETTITYSGYIRFRDLSGLFGFQLDFGNLKIRYADATGFEQIAANGFEKGQYSANGITHQTDVTYTITYQYDNAVAVGLQATAPVNGSVSWVYKESSSYDPDGTLSLESDIPSGDLSFTMDYRLIASGDEGAGAFRFTMETTDPLAIDAVSCNGPTDGTIVGDLNGNGDVGFTIVWSACDTYTVTTRGTTGGAPAVAAR